MIVQWNHRFHVSQRQCILPRSVAIWKIRNHAFCNLIGGFKVSEVSLSIYIHAYTNAYTYYYTSPSEGMVSTHLNQCLVS